MMHIFLDMDDVLYDWYGAVISNFGITKSELRAAGKKCRDAGDLDDHAPLHSLVNSRRIDQYMNDVSADWWHNLSRLPWASDLVKLCSRYSGDITLLSTIIHPSAGTGKALQAAMWPLPLILAPPRMKHLLAGPGRVLIDDHRTNCAMWREAGGAAFVFPTISSEDEELTTPDILLIVEDFLKYKSAEVTPRGMIMGIDMAKPGSESTSITKSTPRGFEVFKQYEGSAREGYHLWYDAFEMESGVQHLRKTVEDFGYENFPILEGDCDRLTAGLHRKIDPFAMVIYASDGISYTPYCTLAYFKDVVQKQTEGMEWQYGYWYDEYRRIAFFADGVHLDKKALLALLEIP